MVRKRPQQKTRSPGDILGAALARQGLKYIHQLKSKVFSHREQVSKPPPPTPPVRSDGLGRATRAYQFLYKHEGHIVFSLLSLGLAVVLADLYCARRERDIARQFYEARHSRRAAAAA
eukprot:CAMPEP_0177585480 /NCGR_PEP_ID=MMETSP0419_2-20121207/4516_1 /TAXON_ID=582737 /ORGANISM="Tetraselmis sp., Strain GSL018" /LENGTH=117 /DNA_ID=CAMNT_0019075217 /DNA_START=221 /DNA_END=570 /DNA_ORIENTATION=-